MLRHSTTQKLSMSTKFIYNRNHYIFHFNFDDSLCFVKNTIKLYKISKTYKSKFNVQSWFSNVATACNFNNSWKRHWDAVVKMMWQHDKRVEKLGPKAVPELHTCLHIMLSVTNKNALGGHLNTKTKHKYTTVSKKEGRHSFCDTKNITETCAVQWLLILKDTHIRSSIHDH